MNRSIAVAPTVLAMILMAPPAVYGEVPSARWAVVVGSNAEVLGRAPLRYAHQDAKQLSRALVDLGGFAESNVRLLLDPRPQEVLTALDSLLAKATGAQDGVVLFYYSGHADVRALYPDGAPLPLSEIKRRFRNENISLRVGIVDACRGGGWTGTKGFVADAPFEVTSPEAPAARGTVFVASSSGDQAAHESETLAGSFFTHHFVAGLRGAADDNGDRVIALSEAYRYARQRTVRDAAIYAAGEQHPSFRVTLSGRQDVSMAWLDRGRSTLVVGPRQNVVQVVDLSSGVTAFELPAGEQVMTLAMDDGQYVVRRRDDTGASHVREIDLRPGATIRVDEDDLVIAQKDALRTKTAGDAPGADGLPHPRVELPGFRLRLLGDGSQPITYHLRSQQTLARDRIPGGALENINLADRQLDTYRKLCTSPCEAIVPRGVNRFGVTQGFSDDIIYTRPLWVDSDATVRAEYIDNSGSRITGITIGSLLAATGIGLIIAGVADFSSDGVRDFDDPDFGQPRDGFGANTALVAGGGLGFAIGALVATLSFVLNQDEVELHTEAP